MTSASPAERFADLEQAMIRRSDAIVRSKPFRSPALTVGGKMFAMLVDDRLVITLPAARCTELVDGGRAEPFRSGQRLMREWVLLQGDDPDWEDLAGEALAYVRGAALTPDRRRGAGRGGGPPGERVCPPPGPSTR